MSKDTSIEEKTITVKPQAGFQEAFCSTSVDVVFGGGVLAAGKCGKIDSFVVTPFGLRMVKDLKVGDIISNPDTGGQERIIQLHPMGTFEFYRVNFVDGTHVDCSEGHLWKVRVAGKKTKRYDANGNRDDWRIWETKAMYEFMEKKKEGIHKGWGLSIPVCKPVSFSCPATPTTPRPVQPYILGALLGDGCFGKSMKNYILLCTPDEHIVRRFEEYGYDMSRNTNKNSDKCPSYRIFDKNLLNGIITLGLKDHTAIDKFIPRSYKFATIRERKELIQGLMDTDGYVDSRGHMSYTTISKQLAEDVAFVVRSLGGLASITTKEAGYKDDNGEFHKCNLAYNISITTEHNEELVTLPKKAERVSKLGYKDGKKYYFEKAIESIEPIGRHRSRCITVDNPSGLYMTDDFTVTHNSFALVLALAEPLMTDSNFRALISRKSLGSIKAGGGFVEKFKAIFGADYIRTKESDNPRVSFPNGSFCDLTYLDDSNMAKLRERAKGWEYDVIAIDELTEMSWECFSYVSTRNRGNSKTFTGKFFATMNPKRSHWTRKFLDWYINSEGFIDPEREGKIRYFYVTGSKVEDVVWGNSKEEVYNKCKIDIDRKLKAIGGDYSYENMIKSFTFYQGKMSQNKAMLDNNPDYIGSVAMSGGKVAQALLEGNFNVDPESEDEIPISREAARGVFENDPAVNGEKWITIDLADYGTDNMLMLAWNGFHVIDLKIVGHSTPRDNAIHARLFAQKNEIPECRIIYDATSGRYFNDYIEDAIPYLSSTKPKGLYYLQALTLKDLCFMRLVRMMNKGHVTIADNIAQSVYTHQNLKYTVTVENEFMEECSVVRFDEMNNGKKTLWNKKKMNSMLGHNRSMDLLDPIAMRMLPCVNIEYGNELEAGLQSRQEYEEEMSEESQSIYDETLWC